MQIEQRRGVADGQHSGVFGILSQLLSGELEWRHPIVRKPHQECDPENLSVPSSIGFIALFGIALGNGMVLLTYLNQLLREGRPINEASIEGACLRVRPVLITAGTPCWACCRCCWRPVPAARCNAPLRWW